MDDRDYQTDAPSRRGSRTYLKQALAVAPYARRYVRYAPKHPAVWLGAAALGVMGMLAWRNRQRIAEVARPMMDTAAERGARLRERMPWPQRSQDGAAGSDGLQ